MKLILKRLGEIAGYDVESKDDGRRKPPRKPKKKKTRGSTRMRQMGSRRVDVWFEPNEYELVKKFCERRKHAVASFVRTAALDAAGYTLFKEKANG